MQLFFIICANIFVACLSKGTSNGNCYIKEVEDDQWLTGYYNDPVADNEDEEFKRFSIENIESVEIVEDHYGKYFSAEIKNNWLLILPTNEFENYEINENSTNDPMMTLRLDFKCKTGERQLLFYQPIVDVNTYVPEFQQRSYTYRLPMPLPAGFDISAFGDKIVACDVDISNIRIDFSITAEEDFVVFWGGPINGANKCHEAILTTANPLRLTFSKVYDITVQDMGIPPRNQTATVTVGINEKNSLPLNPVFENPYYVASYLYSEDGKHSIHVDNPIRLKEGCSNTNLEVTEYKDNFKVYCGSNEVYVELIRNFVSNILKNSTMVVTTIQAATLDSDQPGRTALEIYVEQETEGCATSSSLQCPPCPAASDECSTPIFCPYSSSDGLSHSGCTITPEAPNLPIINFRKDDYNFRITAHYQGYIGAVKAIIIPEEDVEYSIVAVSNVPDVVDWDKKTGVLRLTKPLYDGTYVFTAYAEGVKSKVKAEASVKLSVTWYDYEAYSINSMLVEHVTEEESRSYITLPCSYTFCSYTAIEAYPRSSTIYVHIDSQNITVLAVDRESIRVPQFVLIIRMFGSPHPPSYNDDSHVVSKRNTNWEDMSREWVFLPSDVIHAANHILLSIVIDDINDNRPIFEEGERIVVGYPHKALAELFSPPYLVKVSATDLDAGENATIRYSTRSSRFIIHPKTGVVYPGKLASYSKSNLKFNVTATDRDGAVDGLSTDLEIEVKLLSVNHIAAVIFENSTLEDVEFIIANLSEEANMTLGRLSASVISNCCKNASMQSGNNSINYSTRIFIYALDETDEPVEAYHLRKILQVSKTFPNLMWFEGDLRTSFGNSKYNKDSSEKGNPRESDCLAINVVLVTLLVCFMVAASVLCYCKRNKNGERF